MLSIYKRASLRVNYKCIQFCIASNVSVNKYGTTERQLTPKQEFLTELTNTSNSLLQGLLYKNISLRLGAHRIDYRIKPSALSALLSSEKLTKLLYFLHHRYDQLNTREKTIIFKIITIINSQSSDATLSNLLTKIEQDLLANLEGCDIVDINNILESNLNTTHLKIYVSEL